MFWIVDGKYTGFLTLLKMNGLFDVDGEAKNKSPRKDGDSSHMTEQSNQQCYECV